MKNNGRVCWREVLPVIMAASAFFAVGCQHYGHAHHDSSYQARDPDLVFEPPTITFYRDEGEVPFYYEEEGYPFYSYYPYFPYYPLGYGNPFYQYYH